MAKPIRVLIADDHPIVREGLTAILNLEKDLEVVGQASTGVEAVSLAGKLRPDIILMDLQMPEMDGVEAIKRVKEKSPHIEIIILTTYDTDEYIFRGLEAGARAFVLKDVSPTEVVDAIRAVHRGESVLEPRIATRVLDRLGQLSRASVSEEVLSSREVEVLRLVAKGGTNKEIASQLVIGESTVKTHLIHIFNKLGVKDRTEAVAEAVKRGIIRL